MPLLLVSFSSSSAAWLKYLLRVPCPKKASTLMDVRLVAGDSACQPAVTPSVASQWERLAGLSSPSSRHTNRHVSSC